MKRRTFSGLASSFAFVQLVLVVACAPPPKPCPAPEAPAHTPSVPVAKVKASNRPVLAVLPVDDDLLFRSERSQLRRELLALIAHQAPEYRILPLPKVDARLRARSKAGARCAYEDASWREKAKRQNWRHTQLVHVFGGRDKPEELWAEVRSSAATEVVLSAPYNAKEPPLERYHSAFSAMARDPERLAFGGLFGEMVERQRGSLTSGGLTLCEKLDTLACSDNTAKLADVAPQMARCFAGIDELNTSLVLDGAACEMSLLNDVSGPSGQRERCLCEALRNSAGALAAAGRRRLMLSYQASDLADKPRPQVRVVEASTDMRSRLDHHSVKRVKDGKKTYRSVNRLIVDNVDALVAPLSRCAAPPKAIAVVELEVTEAGRVGAAAVLSGLREMRLKACVESALMRGAFDCTSGGAPGRLRLTIAWPD